MRPDRSALFLLVPLLIAGLLPAVVPAAVQAGDGRLEIHEACVAQGCFPGDTPGFPVVITSGGSYVLTSDLRVGDIGLSAIQILTSGVNLDLNGFSVGGVYTCSSNPPDCDPGRGAAAGILATGSQVTVRNGTVERFGGAQVQLGSISRAEDLLVRFGGGEGIQVDLGSTVRGCLVSSQRQVGIRVFNPFLAIAVDGHVEGNFIRSARGGGIEMSGGFAVRNSVSNSSPGATFSSSTGYSQNRFPSAPSAGVSAGDNICGSGTC